MDSIELLRLMYQSMKQNKNKMKELLFNKPAVMTLELDEEISASSEDILFEERLAHIKELNTP